MGEGRPEAADRHDAAAAVAPAGSATYEGLIGFLEGELDRAAAATPNPGRPVLHRLNRAEYANAIRDVLGARCGRRLAAAARRFGVRLRQYLRRAGRVAVAAGALPDGGQRRSARLAVGDPDVAPGSDTFGIRQDLSQDQHIDGLPLGTVGGILVRHTFPLDGEYIFQVKLYRTNLNIVRGLQYPHQVEFTVDGERVHLAAIGGKADLAALFEKPTDTGDAVEARLRVRVPVKAGPHASR